MPINDLRLKYDDVCVYATTAVKANITAKIILALINLFLLGIITVFFVEQVLLAAFVFLGLELFVVKYTLWNLFGEERLIINTKSISYQQHYGFFTTPFRTINLNKKVIVLPYDKVVDGEKINVKFLFESYDENNLPYVVYHSVLNVPDVDFEKLIRKIDELFIDEMSASYAMPTIHMN